MAQIAGWRAGVAQLVGQWDSFVEVYIQVTGAAVFYAAPDRQSLENTSAIQPGLALSQANTNPPFKLTWIGPLYIMANASGSVIEVTPTIKPGGNQISAQTS